MPALPPPPIPDAARIAMLEMRVAALHATCQALAARLDGLTAQLHAGEVTGELRQLLADRRTPPTVTHPNGSAPPPPE